MSRQNSGSALWERAQTLIPGGNQLLSKRSERFLPGLWPAYYATAKGCEVWDLDGNHYYDFAQMGVGTCSLGYADPDVTEAVLQGVRDGSMCSLNCPEEVELAQRLVDLHPWSGMVRFARTGGEACAIAVRIARAASGRSRVAFCGYHGWHDWYLSANLRTGTDLDAHLLSGLEPVGVPDGLRGTALPFMYNDLAELEALADRYGDEIGCIIMEPMRGLAPAQGFLEGVRAVADRLGAPLVFDEVTSGFRMNFGGIHATLGVEPDIAVYGKALGNGHPIAAVVGRREIMDAAQDTFISSTYWTERTGFVAALATLAKMERENVQAHLVHYGERLNAGWRRLSEKHGLPVHIDGIPPLTHIGFQVDDPQAAQTLYAQEMLGKGYLLGAAVYTTWAYSDAVIDGFIEASDEVFALLATAHGEGDFRKYLQTRPLESGFQRLNG